MRQLPVSYVQVHALRPVSPYMLRVTFGGDTRVDTLSDEPDQQVKLYFPRPGQSVPRLPEPDPGTDLTSWYQRYLALPEPERPWMRSYTLRSFDRPNHTLDVDFVLHPDAGPATRWARRARPGDTLGMFGPSPDFARPVPLSRSIAAADWLLFAGDETALPAIGNLLERLPAGKRAVVRVEVADGAEEQPLTSPGQVDLRWLHRDGVPAGRSDGLLRAVRGLDLPPGAGFAWLAGEAGTVRALRRHLVEERGLPKRSIDFAGYWRLRLSQDDAPTEEDLAEARERLADAHAG